MQFEVGKRYNFRNPTTGVTSIRTLVHKATQEMCFESNIGELFVTFPNGQCIDRKYGDAVSVYREPVVAYAVLDASGGVLYFSRYADIQLLAGHTLITLKEVK